MASIAVGGGVGVASPASSGYLHIVSAGVQRPGAMQGATLGSMKVG